MGEGVTEWWHSQGVFCRIQSGRTHNCRLPWLSAVVDGPKVDIVGLWQSGLEP